MSELTYTVKEILDLQFKSQAKEFEEIKQLIMKQEVNTDREFARLHTKIVGLETKVDQLEGDNARYKIIWGIGATVGASLVAFSLNRLF